MCMPTSKSCDPLPLNSAQTCCQKYGVSEVFDMPAVSNPDSNAKEIYDAQGII